jgi:MYXO-CTERM domain-containing protein
MRNHRRSLGFLLSALVVAALAPPAAAAPKGASSARSEKIQGGLPLMFMRRPAMDGSGRSVAPASSASVTIHFSSAPTAADVAALRALGVQLELDASGSPAVYERFVIGEIPAAAVDEVAALPRVERIVLDGSPFPPPPPLDVTAAEVQATDAWGTSAPDGGRLAGKGITLCDIDSGIDVFHPMFFRADGGYKTWIDVDGDGAFTPGVDGVDLDGSGKPQLLRVQNELVTSYFDETPLLGSDDPAFDPSMDYLYVDANGNGTRDFGPSQGFKESDPTYGELLLVADDVNGNGKLDLGEKVVALGTSKIRAVRTDKNKVFRRGTDLLSAPTSEEMAHGTGASGILVGGNRGLTRMVGIAPDAELIMTSSRGSDVSMANFCVKEGARVVLHEYAPWVGYHLDGSSAMEKLIDTTTQKAGGMGVSHINPAGNLSTSKKLYKHVVTAAAESIVAVDVPADSPYGKFTLFAASFLWLDASRPLTLTLEDPTGFSMEMPSGQAPVQTAWHDGLTIGAQRIVSTRGTVRVDIFIFGQTATPPPVPAGTWKLHVVDATPAGAADMPFIGYVEDELSGWGPGINFPEHSSEEHLIGYPGTADHGLPVSAYTGHGFEGGKPGERAYYSGRGHRIDGEPIMWIGGPDDPVTAGYREGEPGIYFVFGGTSGASPHVAGGAALLLQADPQRTGDDVKAAIKAGALDDDATGAVPNDDFGNGKLRIYKSLYGKDPPGGGAPSISVAPITIAPGKEATVAVVASDPDEAADKLTLDLDREYDGTYEEKLAAPSFPVKFDAEGTYRLKVRVTDSTGKEAAALAVIEVKKGASSTTSSSSSSTSSSSSSGATGGDDGGCGCAVAESHPWIGAWPAAALLAGLSARRRRRAASRRSGSPRR